MNLPFVRFVKQVSNGLSASKHGYIDMMEKNAKSLEDIPWREAQCDPGSVALTGNQISRTDGKVDSDTGEWIKIPTYTAYIDDRYDAFNMAGDAVPRMGTMCGYAGCVAYRFTLPKDPEDETVTSRLKSISIAAQRDRYLRAGVRLSVMPSYVDDSSSSGGRDLDTPNDFSWTEVREGFSGLRTPSESAAGVDGVASWGFMNQRSVPYILESMSEGATWTIDSVSEAVNDVVAESKYLWVFMTLEDPAGFWDLYSASERRFYYIEGAAVLMPSKCDFTFLNDGTESPDIDIGAEHSYVVLSGRQGPTRFTADSEIPSYQSSRLLNGDPVLQKYDAGTSGSIDAMPFGDSAMGLRAVSGDFYSRKTSIKREPGIMSLAFSLNRSTDTFFGDATQTVRCWQIAAGGMAVPFKVPFLFVPKFVKFDWSGSGNAEYIPKGTDSNGNAAFGRIFVYLLRDTFADSIPDVASNPEAWLGNPVSGAESLGHFDVHETFPKKEAVLAIPSGLSGSVATLVLLPSWPYMDEHNPKDLSDLDSGSSSSSSSDGDSKLGFGDLSYSCGTGLMFDVDRGIIPDIILEG